MNKSDGKLAIQRRTVVSPGREHICRIDRSLEQVPVQASSLAELGGTSKNWIVADDSNLRKRCIVYEAQICKLIEKLNHHELALVRDAFRLSLSGNS